MHSTPMIFRAPCGVGSVCLALLTPTPVVADSAFFDPPLREVAAGQVAAFDLYLTPQTLTSFDAADVIIGSDTLPGLDFIFSSAFTVAMDMVTGPIPGGAIYNEQLYVGGFRFSGTVGGPLLVGTLIAETSGLSPGDYTVLIDGLVDMTSGVSVGGQMEPLVAAGGGPIVATVHVPEPSGGLFVLTAAGVIVCRRGRRRRE